MSDDLGYLVERMKVRLEETEGARQAEAEQSSSSQAVDEVLAELKAARENPALSGSGATCSPRASAQRPSGSCFAGPLVDAFDATLFAKLLAPARRRGAGWRRRSRVLLLSQRSSRREGLVSGLAFACGQASGRLP